MRLYPPYKKHTVDIKCPTEFLAFLKDNIESHNSNHDARLKGVITEDGFKVEKKSIFYNSGRPQIRGIITSTEVGKKKLTAYIESYNFLFILMLIFALMVLITAVIQSNYLVLIGIPVSTVWFYVCGFLLSRIEIKRTKAELKNILEAATREKQPLKNPNEF